MNYWQMPGVLYSRRLSFWCYLSSKSMDGFLPVVEGWLDNSLSFPTIDSTQQAFPNYHNSCLGPSCPLCVHLCTVSVDVQFVVCWLLVVLLEFSYPPSDAHAKASEVEMILYLHAGLGDSDVKCAPCFWRLCKFCAPIYCSNPSVPHSRIKTAFWWYVYFKLRFGCCCARARLPWWVKM